MNNHDEPAREPYGWDCAGALVRAKLTMEAFVRDGYKPIPLFMVERTALLAQKDARIAALESALRAARGHIALLGGEIRPDDDDQDEIQVGVLKCIDAALKKEQG